MASYTCVGKDLGFLKLTLKMLESWARRRVFRGPRNRSGSAGSAEGLRLTDRIRSLEQKWKAVCGSAHGQRQWLRCDRISRAELYSLMAHNGT